MNRNFLFITDANKDYLGHFPKENFLHLTGVVLNDDNLCPKFYDMCKNKTLNIKNIKDLQTHSYENIKKKLKLLKNLTDFVENRIDQQNLIIDKPSSLTREYLFALRNDLSCYTIQFSKDNNAKSNRFERFAQGVIREKVIMILNSTGDGEFNNLIYLDSNYKMIDIIKNLSNRYEITKNGGIKRK